MKAIPPRWINRFLEWYCRPDRLEEIQGDAWELYQRRFKQNRAKAFILFHWDVLRFFRLKNIRKQKRNSNTISTAMLKNLLTVAFRNFKRQPGHSITNIIGLSAGLACAFLIMLWVVQETSYDQFHADHNKIYRVLSHSKAVDNIQTYTVASASMNISSVPEIENFVSVSTGTRWPHELCFRAKGKPDECLYYNGVYVKGSFFQVFDFPVLSGKYTDEKPDQIAISEKMASAMFGTSDAVGKIIKIDNRHDVSVTAVFKNVPINSSLQFEFVMPFAILQKEWGATDVQINENFFEAYIKTSKPENAKLLTARINDDRVLPQNLKKDGISYEAYPLTQWHLNSKFENGKNTGGKIEYVILFIVIAILILVMAIINFINMTTARAAMRAKEIGIRKVTGAFRSGIVIQFMGESFLIVLTAFSLAALIVQFSLPAFNTLLSEPVSINLLSGWIPLYLFGFLLLIAFAAGIYPALILSSFQPVAILRDRTTGGSTGSNGLRRILLVVQLSVSLGILIFSGVIYRQLDYIIGKDLGFDRENMIHIEPTWKILQKLDVFKTLLHESPTIINLTNTNANPLDAGGGNTGVQWPGKPANERVAFTTIGCTYEFTETFGLHIKEGRTFTPETRDTLNTEVLVTEDAVKTMGLKNPVGEHIKIGDSQCVIIGVVNDFHTGSLRNKKLPVIIFRVGWANTGQMYIRYQPGTTQEALAAIQKAFATIEPGYTMKYWFQDDTFNGIYKTEKTASRLALLFTFITVLISFIGIIGLAAFNIVRKTKEIGIRRVFGATVLQVLGLVTTEFWKLLLAALVISVPLTWFAANRWLNGFEYHTAMPWGWYGITFAAMAGLTMLIVCIQALKTAAANPTKSLRSE